MSGAPPACHGRAMTKSEAFQLDEAAAEMYEATFVPRVFEQWAPHTLDVAGLTAGGRLLDVACGTGIVARTAVDRIGPGAIVGVDLNPAMLAVARRVAPEIDWRRADVVDLPFGTGSFDAVTCQMAFMFFPDRHGALTEMARVARPGGRVALVVPASLDSQPAYQPFVDIAARHCGPEARALLGAYWSCGDADDLVRMVDAVDGLRVVERRTRTGTASFESSDDLVATEVEATPLIDRIDERTYATLRREVGEALARFNTAKGFEVPLVSHLIGAEAVRRDA